MGKDIPRYSNILVATDLFTIWVEAVPLTDQSVVSVAKTFVESVAHQALLTDQGPSF